MTLRGQIIDTTKGGRPTCYACLRPTSHCLCGQLTRFTAHCNILILQHPNEWRKYYSTAKLVAGSVINARLLRGVEFEEGVIEGALKGQESYILFPAADAADCESVLLTPNSTVVVIDGTWDEARKVMRRNSCLTQLPCLTFKTVLRSNYRIRKQPREHYLSTLESVGHMLMLNAAANGLFEKQRQYQSLFTAFNRMVEQQFNYFPRMRSDLSKEVPAAPQNCAVE